MQDTDTPGKYNKQMQKDRQNTGHHALFAENYWLIADSSPSHMMTVRYLFSTTPEAELLTFCSSAALPFAVFHRVKHSPDSD